MPPEKQTNDPPKKKPKNDPKFAPPGPPDDFYRRGNSTSANYDKIRYGADIHRVGGTVWSDKNMGISARDAPDRAWREDRTYRAKSEALGQNLKARRDPSDHAHILVGPSVPMKTPKFEAAVNEFNQTSTKIGSTPQLSTSFPPKKRQDSTSGGIGSTTKAPQKIRRETK